MHIYHRVPTQHKHGVKRKEHEKSGKENVRQAKGDHSEMNEVHINFKESWLNQLRGIRPNKKKRTERKSSVTIGTTINKLNKHKSKRNHGSRAKDKSLRILFDSGSSGVIIKNKYVKDSQYVRNSKKEKWSTKAGDFITDGQANISFTLDEFDPKRVIHWKAYTYDAKKNDEQDQFDMIIGEDLMFELGLTLNYKLGCITWDGITRPMRSAFTSSKAVTGGA